MWSFTFSVSGSRESYYITHKNYGRLTQLKDSIGLGKGGHKLECF